MIKTAIKHFLFDHAINVMFNKIHSNFMFADSDVLIKAGTTFKHIEANFLGYTCYLTNATVTNILEFGFTGPFVELFSVDPIKMFKNPDYDKIIDSGVCEKSIKYVVEKSIIKCNTCQSPDAYYLLAPIAVSKADIRIIEQ